VVWNCTQACNLDCEHCYACSGKKTASPDELDTSQARAFIEDLADFGAPVLLFSGGEPLVRPDLLDLVSHAGSLGLRTVLSTNGTLIDDRAASQIKACGVAYVGVSLDGLAPVHDRFRGRTGAFDASVRGIRACRNAGVKVGLRFTVTRGNVAEIPGIFDLVEQEGIPRVCFYHFVPAGRGADQREQALGNRETRETVDLIMDRTEQLNCGGRRVEVLTVANHADGPYIVLRLERENRLDAARNAMRLLEMNGGNSSGCAIGCVGWDGTVYPDQFWRNHALGNVTERSFSEIWSDAAHPLLRGLRQFPRPVRGRCETCRFLPVCNGNLRARAEAMTGDPWACDPACYLTDREIADSGAGGPQA
jgi:radical SAM protein with 4Fe4S-binding SPASM domain